MILLKVRDARNDLEVTIELCQSCNADLGHVVRLKIDMGHAYMFGRVGNLAYRPLCLGCVHGI